MVMLRNKVTYGLCMNLIVHASSCYMGLMVEIRMIPMFMTKHVIGCVVLCIDNTAVCPFSLI